MSTTVITIGSEILSGHTLDTNFLEITRQLLAWGYPVGEHVTVPDGEACIGEALGRALARAGLVVVTGGLGGTPDDLTLDAVARTLGLRVEESQALLAAFEARYKRPPSPTLRRIARVIEGATLLENPVGQAPGVLLRVAEGAGAGIGAGARIVLLPGVPEEMRGILRTSLLPALGLGPEGARTTFRTVGRGEGDLAELLSANGIHGLAFLPSPGRVDLVLPAGASADLHAAVRSLLGEAIFTEGDASLEECVCMSLWEREASLAVAESLTGGAVGAAITRVPGASRCFLGSQTVYSNALKTGWLGVPSHLFATEGAVSPKVAAAMAARVRELAGADWALSATGIAGPDGATAAKPIGLVYMGLAFPNGRTHVVRHRFLGDRRGVIERAVTASLDLLRRGVLGLSLPEAVV